MVFLYKFQYSLEIHFAELFLGYPNHINMFQYSLEIHPYPWNALQLPHQHLFQYSLEIHWKNLRRWAGWLIRVSIFSWNTRRTGRLSTRAWRSFNILLKYTKYNELLREIQRGKRFNILLKYTKIKFNWITPSTSPAFQYSLEIHYT